MNETDDRPSPDALLQRVKAEEALGSRAVLKVFFGYAPGVGKTYTMLESAWRLRAQGVDVAVGFIETHGRSETAELLDGLEVLPRRRVTYRGAVLEEFDLDRALARHPAILLLDELAHTNVPGSRHAKRWQDALELLDAGITVHTTLNVQHIESLNDVVAQITTVRVRETVPDSVLERAEEIELVDLPPDDLLVRLREGKVYIPEQARRAIDHFFRRGNLLALRELTLRRAAERLDEDVRAYRRAHEIEATWPAAERILVCVGASPSSARIIRAARRIAAGLRAPWVAAYVEAGDAYSMTQADRERLQAHLRLAESLGGDVVRLSGSHVSDELLRYAHDHNVTRIVIGKPGHGRWRDLLRGSLVTRLTRGSGDIEIHFISGDEMPSPGGGPAPRPARRVEWRGIAWAGLLVGAVTILTWLGRAFLSQADVVMAYVLAIMITAFRFGQIPSVVAAGLSVLAYDFFFVQPLYGLDVEHTRHLLTFAMMFGVGLAISSLTSRLRRYGRAAREREERTAALYALTRELVTIRDEGQAAEVIAHQAAEVFGGEALVLLRQAEGSLRIGGRSHAGPDLDSDDAAVARWTAEHGRLAGPGTDTLPGAHLTCVPLQVGPETLGVLALHLPSLDVLEAEHRNFLEAFTRQAALSFERTRLAEAARAAALRARTEELRGTLLSAVSHDLRTPLAAITGAGTALREDRGRLADGQRAELYDTICTEADRMERLVTNILDTVRLESGGLVPKKEWVPLEEIVGSALARLETKLGDREVRLDLPETLPLLRVDPILFEQVIVNLIENALKYAGPGGPIEVEARSSESAVEVTVADRGPGLPPGDEERVFEKFYRGPTARGGGVGLGLPICRGIVQAHGGSLAAENRPGGGASFRIRLPLTDKPPSIEPEDESADDARSAGGQP